jgi:hypothetical protein
MVEDTPRDDQADSFISPTNGVITVSNPLPNSKPKKFSLKHIIFILVIVILAFFSFGYFFLFMSPQAEAKAYLKEVTKDFQDIMSKINNFGDKFNNLTKFVEKSKESFAEIASPVDYEYALVDTKQDIDDIDQTLELITQAKIDKEKFNIPEEIKTLDDKLSKYYQNAEEAMTLLLAHQQFQMDMLKAHGSELIKQLKEAELLMKSQYSRSELINTFSNIATFSGQAVQNFKTITAIPDSEKDYYQIKLDGLNDLAITFASISAQLNLATMEGDKNFVNLMLESSSRASQRNLLVEKMSQDYIKNSKINTILTENDILEKEIVNELKNLTEKYNIEIDIPQESTITPTITNHTEILPSITAIPEVIIESPKPSDSAVNQDF